MVSGFARYIEKQSSNVDATLIVILRSAKSKSC